MTRRPHLVFSLFGFLALGLVTSACPSEPPVDDDDSAADDDDSAASDDDDSACPPPPVWAAGPGASYVSFSGGGRQLGSVMDAGFDLDGDGVPDMAFGTPMDFEDLPDETNRGRVYIFFGTTVAAPGDFDVALDADAVIVGATDEMRLGRVVAGHGDIDGDGLDDLIVGSSTQMETWVFFGATLALGGTFTTDDADRVLAAQVPECVHYVGDVDGDGRDDILLANTLNSMAGNVAGRTFLISGMSLADATEPLSVFQGYASFPGEGPAQASGCASGPAGDVDGDGLMDIMIGTQGNSEGGGPNAGKISFFTGASLLAAEGGLTFLTDADWRFLGEAGDDRLGTDMAAIGDFDGDLRTDFVFSARNNDESGDDAGKTYLFLAETLQTKNPEPSTFEGDLNLLGEAPFDKSGTAVSALGDVDGDGLPDFAIGAPRNDRGGKDAGSAYVIESRLIAAGGGSLGLSAAAGILSGNQANSRFGDQLVGAGDVDGDGFSDLLVGAPRQSDVEGADDQGGAVWLFVSPHGAAP
jgi:hypothetical protein